MSEFLVVIALICQAGDGLGRQSYQKKCVASLLKCYLDKSITKIEFKDERAMATCIQEAAK